MIIELTGLPGAGKTTFESCIIRELSKRGIQVNVREELQIKYKQGIISPDYENHRVIRILTNRLYRILKWKNLISAGLGSGVFREFLTKRRRLVFSWLGEDISLSTYFIQKLKPSQMEPIVYMPHEGFVHHCASFKVWGGVGFPDLPQKLLKKFSPKDFCIIYFKLSVDDALERVSKRGLPDLWPSSINSESKVKEVLVRFDEAIEDVVEKFQSSGVKVFPVDSSLAIDRVESKVKTILDTVLQNSGEPQ